MRSIKYLKFVYYSCFVDYISSAFVYPVFTLIFFSQNFGTSIFSQDVSINIKSYYFALSIGIFYLGDFCGSFIFPKLSDKYGRIKLLLLLSLVGVLGQCLSLYSLYQKNANYMVLSRFILGLAGSLTAICKAIIGDVSSEENRVNNFSKLSKVYAFSFLLGPIISTIFMDESIGKWFNYITPFWVLFVLYLSVFLWILPLKEIKLGPLSERAINLKDEFKMYFKVEKIKNIFLWIFFYSLAWSAFFTFLPIILVQTKNLSHIEIGYIYSYIGLWMYLVQTFITKYIHRYGLTKIILGCFCIETLFFCITYPFFVGPMTLIVLIYIPMISMTHNIIQTSMGISISDVSVKENRGVLQGIGAATRTLPGFLGPILASFLIEMNIYYVIIFSVLAMIGAVLSLKR
jgi:DHA1 family tetracycline resistance protein-like MFS transporter